MNIVLYLRYSIWAEKLYHLKQTCSLVIIIHYNLIWSWMWRIRTILSLHKSLNIKEYSERISYRVITRWKVIFTCNGTYSDKYVSNNKVFSLVLSINLKCLYLVHLHRAHKKFYLFVYTDYVGIQVVFNSCLSYLNSKWLQ